jgi:hypothetical protein
MKARLWPILALIFGALALAAFVGLGSQPAVSNVYAASEVSPAVSAFQRSETPADIAAVFGAPADPARIAAMDALNTLDLYAFIPAYTLFLIAAAIMLGGLANRWTQTAIAFAILGGAFDAIETWKQLELTANIENVEAYLPIAPWHWLKYTALALNGVAIASLCITNKRWILSIIALVSFPLVALSYMDLLTTRAFAASFAVYWIALLVVSAITLVRARGSQA